MASKCAIATEAPITISSLQAELNLRKNVFGGGEKSDSLQSIRAVRWKGTGIIQTNAGEKISTQLEEVSVYPDKFYRQMQLPAGQIREVITPEFNYISSGSNINPVPKADLLQERAAWRSSPIYIAQRIGDYRCVPEGPEQIGNILTAKLRISVDEIEFHWNVDPSSGRLLRVRVQTSNGEMVNDISDWRLVEGVYVSFRSHRLVSGRTFDRTITEYQLNPIIDAKLFEPPSQATSNSQSLTLGRSTLPGSTASSSQPASTASSSQPASTASSSQLAPGTKQRSLYLKSIEQNMRWLGFDDARVSVTGKAKDVMLVWMPTASTAGMRSLEEQCIEPIREQLRSAGFRTVEIRNGNIRWAPEWKWDVSLRNWDDPVQ